MEHQDDSIAICDSIRGELGDDVLMEIFSQLPLKSLFRFKCVCKAWHNLISAQYTTESTLQKSFSGFYYHINGVDQNDSKFKEYRYICVTSDQLSIDSAKDVTGLNFLPCYPNFRIIDSCNGLLVCLTGNYKTTPYFVCNPLTKTWSILPKPPKRYQQACAQLEFDPRVSSTYRVILTKGIIVWPSQYVELAIFSSDISRWVECKLLLPSLEGDYFSFTSFVFTDGILYAIQRGHSSHFLLKICIKEEKHQSIPLPVENAYSETLLKLQSCLYFIAYSDWVIQIWELSEASNMEWVLKHKASVELAKDELSLHCNFSFHVNDFHPLAYYPNQGVVLLRRQWMIFSYHLGSDKLEEVCRLLSGYPRHHYHDPYSWCSPVYPYSPSVNRLLHSNLL